MAAGKAVQTMVLVIFHRNKGDELVTMYAFSGCGRCQGVT